MGRHLRAVTGLLLLALFLLLAVTPLVGQAPAAPSSPLYIFADTAGVDRLDPSEPVYVTWIYARASESEDSPPVSGVLVAFDCQRRMVRRLAQVKFNLLPNGMVGGLVQEVDGDWQAPVIPRLFTLICVVGAAHDRDSGRGYGPTPPVDPKPPQQPS